MAVNDLQIMMETYDNKIKSQSIKKKHSDPSFVLNSRSMDRNIEMIFESMTMRGSRQFSVRVLHELIEEENVSFQFPNDVDVISFWRLHESVKTFSAELKVFLLQQRNRRYRNEGGDEGVHSIPVIDDFFSHSMVGSCEYVGHLSGSLGLLLQSITRRLLSKTMVDDVIVGIEQLRCVMVVFDVLSSSNANGKEFVV
jgi:hypothetical protein